MMLDKNLRDLLRVNSLTITMAAKLVGLSTSTLHDYCWGRAPKNIAELKELANLLDVSLDELFFAPDPSDNAKCDKFSCRISTNEKSV